MLIIVQGKLDERPAGPVIRGTEIARSLAARHDVTIAASVDRPSEYERIRVVPRARRSLLAAIREHDAVIGPLLPPYLLCALARNPCLRVADLYDPVDLEVATLSSGTRARRALETQQLLRALQLRWSDVVVCANERQRERAARDIEQMGRRDGGPILINLPMGIAEPSEAVATNEHPLRRRFGISENDPVVLWWGSVWRWLDAGTAIRAIGQVAKRLPRLRFIITAGPPPARVDPLNAASDARDLARDLGLLGRNVFFLDEWVPYEERNAYLNDADLGLTLHGATREATLAARARYMDYLGASLPSVLAEGDELADEMAAARASWLVPARDERATARAIEQVLLDRTQLASAREGCRAMAARYRWSALTEPLVAQIESSSPAEHSLPATLHLARESGRFYVQRALELCAPS